jgi:peptidoglycan-associated lipoprotein
MLRVLAIAALLGAAGCKKKHPEVVETPPPVRVNPPAQVLQVVTVSPNVVGNGRPTSVMVVGAGFQQGAMVRVGEIPATSATWRNPNQLEVQLPPLELGSYDVAVVNPDATESVLASGLSVRASGPPELAIEDCRRIVVFFGTDEDEIPADARQALDNALGCWRSLEVPIKVDGHADERGTTDYNLALGQRRALAVREYLVTAGLPRTRLPITSYGEENPLDKGWGEQAWAQNRRVELVIE